MSKLSLLKNAVSLVTGGASGLGRATAERFAMAGSKVAILDLPSSNGEEVAQKIGKDCLFTPADITEEEDVASAMDRVVSEFGSLHYLINCAGKGSARKTLNFGRREEHELELFDDIMTTNLVGTFNVISHAVPIMCKNPAGLTEDNLRGVIVNTSSMSAFDGQSGQVAYSASKGGLVSMTLPLARELAPQGIRVVCIAPGLFYTAMTVEIPDKIKKILSKLVPFPQRFGMPEEFAHFCQEAVENPMLNGETIRLDGAIRMLP